MLNIPTGFFIFVTVISFLIAGGCSGVLQVILEAANGATNSNYVMPKFTGIRRIITLIFLPIGCIFLFLSINSSSIDKTDINILKENSLINTYFSDRNALESLSSPENPNKVKAPYIIIDITKDEIEKIKYSEGVHLKDDSLNEMETIILVYSTVYAKQEYVHSTNGVKDYTTSLSRYETKLYFFDAKSNELLTISAGLLGPDFPDNGKGYNGKITNSKIIQEAEKMIFK